MTRLLTPVVYKFLDNVAELRNPTQICDLLDAHLRLAPITRHVHVIGIWYAPPRPQNHIRQYVPNKTILWAKEFSVAFRQEYFQQLVEHGSSPLQVYGRTRSAAFTLTEAMRATKLTGRDRWVFDLFAKHHMRDGLYCPFRHWILVFWSEQVLPKRADARVFYALLETAASAAIRQTEKLVPDPERFERNRARGLTERDLAVLRLAAQGLTASQMAATLETSNKTVRNQLEDVRARLEARNMTQACVEAVRQGLII